MADETQPVTEPVTAPPPPPVTPLDPPVVYFNQKWHVPPIVVRTQEEADALDPSEWTTIPPPKPPAQGHWPKIYYDVNVPPIVVGSADDLKSIDTSRYKPLTLSKSVIEAAQADAEPPSEPA